MFEQEQWQPTASVKNLLTRAKLLTEIRRFFTDRGLLEVERIWCHGCASRNV